MSRIRILSRFSIPVVTWAALAIHRVTNNTPLQDCWLEAVLRQQGGAIQQLITEHWVNNYNRTNHWNLIPTIWSLAHSTRGDRPGHCLLSSPFMTPVQIWVNWPLSLTESWFVWLLTTFYIKCSILVGKTATTKTSLRGLLSDVSHCSTIWVRICQWAPGRMQLWIIGFPMWDRPEWA